MTGQPIGIDRAEVTTFERLDLFAAPVYLQRVLAARTMNAELVGDALRWERELSGRRVSNRGAYQGTHTLFESPELVQLRELREAILDAYRRIRREVYELDTPPSWEPALLEAWYNVSRADSYFVGHNHLGKGWHWSGVYYVCADLTQSNEGRLIFEHKTKHYDLGPAPIAGIAHLAGRPNCEVAVEPEEGLLVFFPSSLMHRVESFSGNGVRISIAFNIRDDALAWRFPSAHGGKANAQEWLRHYCLGLYLPLKSLLGRITG
jgi:uncharacterized protein (TIGR02466 family)